MKKKQKLIDSNIIFNATLLAMIWYFLLPGAAEAYFDITVGTYMLQIIFAFGATFLLAFRNMWKSRLKAKNLDETPPDQGHL